MAENIFSLETLPLLTDKYNILETFLNEYTKKGRVTTEISQKLYNLYFTKKTSNQICNLENNFRFSIDNNCLKIIIKRWNGWNDLKKNPKTIGNDHCQKFDSYIASNLKFLEEHREKSIQNVIDKYKSECTNVLYVFSSYKELKTLFHSRPHLVNDFCNNNFPQSLKYNSYDSISQKYILNYPYIATKISLPSFEITRQNINFDQFELVDLNIVFDFHRIKPQNTDLYVNNVYDPNGKKINKESLNSSIIIEFIVQLINFIKANVELPTHIGNNLILVLNEFQKDISLCDKGIMIGNEYLKVHTKYPYTRLLGKPHLSDEPKILTSDQLLIVVNSSMEQNYNIRLRQTCQPSVFFALSRFVYEPPFYTNGKFNFPKDYLNRMRYDGLIYECTLCEKSGLLNEIRAHLTVHHDIEPDWICVYCRNSFSTKFLSLNRWFHPCK